MRVLLDENFPAGIVTHIKGHDVYTVHSLGWTGAKNGELLHKANNVCDVFLTLDRNLEHQQNISALPFGVVVVVARSNRLADLIPLVSAIESAILSSKPGHVRHAGV